MSRWCWTSKKMKGISPIISEVLLIAVVVGLSLSVYFYITSFITSKSSLAESLTGSMVIVRDVVPIPPNWYKVTTNNVDASFVVKKKDGSILEPLRTYKMCSSDQCTYYLLLGRYVEKGDVVEAVSGSFTFPFTIDLSPYWIFNDGLEERDSWSDPSSVYTFYVVDDCIKGKCFMLETNTTKRWTWSWMKKYIDIPTGWYLISTYLKTQNNVGTHIPVAEVGGPQLTQINLYSHPSYADTNWVLRTSSFYHLLDKNLGIAINAGKSMDGSESYAWFDELKITPMFNRVRMRTVFIDENDASDLKCWDKVTVHTCTTDDNVIITTKGEWIEINTTDVHHSSIVIELNGRLFSKPAYYEFTAEYNAPSLYPAISTIVLGQSGSEIGRIVNNCMHIPSSSLIEHNCVGLVGIPLWNSDVVLYIIGAWPSPYSIKVRNIAVYEILPG